MDENNLNLENNNVTPEILPKAQPETQPEVQEEVKLEFQSEVQPEVQPEVKPEAQPEGKPEVQPNAANNFSVTENNTWDKHTSFGHTEELAKGQFSALQNPAPAIMPGQPPVPPAPQVPNQFGPQPGPNPNMHGGPTHAPGSYPPPPRAPQPPYANPQRPNTPAAPIDPSKEMTVKDWLLTIFLSYLPIAGLVLLIVWAAEQNPIPKYRPRKTWAAGRLIWVIITYVLAVIFSYIFLFAMIGFLDYFF